jgi:fatty-acyl-CoA synthase
MATHYNLVSAGKAAADRYEYKKGEKVLITLPLFHTFGMQLGVQVSLARRLTMVLVDYFNAQEVLRLIDKEKIASVPSVPTVHADLVYHPDVKNYDISTWKLRTGTMGGSEVPPKLVRDMGEILGAHEMLNGHGMTEQCGLACSCFCSDPVDIVAEFNGKPLDCCEYRIVDPKTWETLPLGQEGEICIRGLNVVKGYYKKPEETSAAYEPDGWFHTGDRGFIHHEHKNVKMVGRIKDIFIVGGENVAPREIEELLFEHPKISQAYVVGVPDRRLGEVGMAFVQLKEGVNLTESEVVDYCKGKIANYKVPRYVKFVTEFPMTSTGKIQKFILREIGEKDVSKLSGT